WIMVMGVAIMGALQLFLKHTRTGLAMQAVAQDPEAAQLMGANLTRMMAYTFAISGMMAGAARIMLGSMVFAFFRGGVHRRVEGVRRGDAGWAWQHHRGNARRNPVRLDRDVQCSVPVVGL